MKKSILNVGRALNKAEQKSVNGGAPDTGLCLDECGPNHPTGFNCGPVAFCTIQACAAPHEAWYCVGNGPNEL